MPLRVGSHARIPVRRTSALEDWCGRLQADELGVRPLAPFARMEAGGRVAWRGGGAVKAHAGDRIVVESERVSQAPRRGIVEEILHDDPPRLRVRWDDG